MGMAGELSELSGAVFLLSPEPDLHSATLPPSSNFCVEKKRKNRMSDEQIDEEIHQLLAEFFLLTKEEFLCEQLSKRYPQPVRL